MKTTAEGPRLRDPSPFLVRPGANGRPAGVRSVNRWLLALVVVLGASLAALGAWTIVDRTTGKSEVEVVWDDALAAWNGNDRPAVESLYAPDAELRTFSDRGVATIPGNEGIGGYVDILRLESAELSRLSSVATAGDLAVSLTSWVTTPGVPPATALDVVQVRDGKIVRQWSFWLGERPLDNALGK